MRSSLPYCILVLIVTGQLVFASQIEAKSLARPSAFKGSITAQNRIVSPDIDLKDSLMAVYETNIEYIKTRYTKLNPCDSGLDTIRKSSDINIDILKANDLSTLKSKGENNFITRNLFSLMIVDNQPIKGQMAVNSALYFAPFTGKRIGSIRFLQLDVFGTSLQDTLQEATGWVEKTANVLHMKSVEQKLRLQLLFNSGEKVNAQLMAENEKIIRDLPYVQDVAITLTPSRKSSDVVDILVIIKEKFEYGISGNLGSNSSELRITDQNMFGLGHQFMASVNFNHLEDPTWGGSFNYEISDLGGKFIKTGLGYTSDYRKTAWNAYLDRQFIASKIDWAGGISIERVFSDNFLTPYSYTRLDTTASYFNSDIWYGRKFKNKNIFSPFGSLIAAGRYFHQNFYNNPSGNALNSLFRNHDLFIGSVGISKRYLFKNNKVYGYGITEDIPYGHYAEMAMGVDIENQRTRPYLHFRYSMARILEGGAYFKWEAGVGGYLYDSHMEQGAILLSTNYFTNFIFLNNHPYRLFFNVELLSGINRFNEEYLVINRKFGIRDFFALDTKGTNRLKINMESVRFWGWSYLGFRFANYFFGDAAFLSDNLKSIFNDKFYAGIGFGFRVHNESLIFNTLELRLSWLPIAPNGVNPFIFNAFGQPKARFDDFLGGKPQEILYQ
ncbi:MAG TPA: hypothetical protein VGK38_02325 [Prolixibacteraceae bacterium]